MGRYAPRLIWATTISGTIPAYLQGGKSTLVPSVLSCAGVLMDTFQFMSSDMYIVVSRFVLPNT